VGGGGACCQQCRVLHVTQVVQYRVVRTMVFVSSAEQYGGWVVGASVCSGVAGCSWRQCAPLSAACFASLICPGPPSVPSPCFHPCSALLYMLLLLLD
jgi:hypothetical protein